MKKSASRFLDKLPSAPIVAILGGGALCLVLIAWIFAPGGFLDSLTAPQEVGNPIAGEPTADEQTTTEPNANEPSANEQEAEVPADLSPEKNAAFLAENAKKPGVKVTPSGLQHRQLSPGTGKRPGPTSTVTVHYSGALIDGKEFDSSKGRAPISFGLTQVIAGWTEGLQLMHEGEKAELVIPQEIGYGARGAPGAIPPYQTLVFEVELIKIR